MGAAEKVVNTAEMSLKTDIEEFYLSLNEDASKQNAFLQFMCQQEADRRAHHKGRLQGAMHASGLKLSGKEPRVCQRHLAYAATIYKSPFTKKYKVAEQANFLAGHLGHAKIQGILTYVYGDDFQAEVPLAMPKHRIVGSCDGVLQYYSKGCKNRVGLEIKTTAEKSFKGLGSRPSQDYMDQITVYMAALELPVLYFIYECRNDLALREYVITWADVSERWEQILKRVKHINEHIENGTKPRRLVNRHVCDVCGFLKDCDPYSQRNIAAAKLLHIGNNKRR